MSLENNATSIDIIMLVCEVSGVRLGRGGGSGLVKCMEYKNML